MVIFTLTLILIINACTQEKDVADEAKDSQTITLGPSKYLERGDLTALKKRGELRVLLPLNQVEGLFLPRSSSAVFNQPLKKSLRNWD